jgi:hypothetical protein
LQRRQQEERLRPTEKNSEQSNPKELRKDLVKMVEAEAEELANAVIAEGKKGQLATVKYLFEMAHIYPQPPEGSVSTTDEESLAKTLLDRLDIPDQPVLHDLYERGEDVVVIPPRAKDAEKPQPQQSEADEESAMAGIE